MVKLTKRELPPDVTITSENDYRSGIVFEMLVEDCYQKCYICEDKPTSINVEHIVSHRSDQKLKYDWNNLFIACPHCNNIKSTRYDDTLNPTECDPEEHIELSVDISEDFIEAVRIEPIKRDSCTLRTVELLGYVYNGGSTDIKEIECANLRNEHLLPDIQRFMQFVKGYNDEPDLGYDVILKKEVNRASKFAAFKRRIIRDYPELMGYRLE
jgi:hypothetical protein